MNDETNNMNQEPVKTESIHRSLAKIQYSLMGLKKDASANRYKYLSLSALSDACINVCGRFGAAISHDTETIFDGDRQIMRVTCTLYSIVDPSQKITSSMQAVIGDAPKNRDGNASMNQLQWVGSATTYLRRYTLQNLLGICADEDDDAGGKYA